MANQRDSRWLIAITAMVIGAAVVYLVAWLIVPKDVDVYPATPVPAPYQPPQQPQYGPQPG